jgi:diketogulonate reductase-like aldo/keto reductase
MNKNRILSNGVEMPSIGMGTYQMDRKTLQNVLLTGTSYGFRCIDTARDYWNEPLVGEAMKIVQRKNGLKREDLFITTKIGNSQQIIGNIEQQIDISLKSLQTDYVDLWLMHWPYPGHYIETWHKMEKIYYSGKVRAIGVCNFRERHLNALIESGISIMPMVMQIEYHPLGTIKPMIALCDKYGIQVEAYSPLCLMDKRLIESEKLKSLAVKYNKTIPQIILRWDIQQGIIPVFKSATPHRLKENINIYDFTLTSDEMELIFTMNEDYKFHPESINCPGY